LIKYEIFDSLDFNTNLKSEMLWSEGCDTQWVPDVDRVLHELASPVFGLVVLQLEVEEPGQVECDGHHYDQRDEVERGLKLRKNQPHYE